MTTQLLGRILVIDDDAEFRSSLAEALAHAGYEVMLAGDGAQGIEALQHRPSDLTITDIFMPVKDGIELITLLKDQFPSTPIVAVSGGPRSPKSALPIDYLSMASTFGADRVLRKPFRLERLLEVVRETIKPAGAPPSAS